ncbi:MBL fold metallo-hydrolase [Bacillus chungangensis]|uniref:Hydroxyacylglutathione hydrolase n=1 Tax=Bacillus chungangensis TaxID=587633 RepID=A0ABT9WS94_9BACI|nr:MBL fold metallo-hydrolase [Bacillus chungangensis]MDQ0176056.1 hydroxyacylglutathione hydrolase [Bacillus chungangensis]
MLLRYFYDEKLAHASYLVGCQASGEAIVVDPSRNIEQYVKAAEAEKVDIVAATETHIHADFVSGAREIAARFQAILYLSDEGDENWKYQNLDGLQSQLLKDGDVFSIGNIDFTVMHTPGHTPESISFLLTDRGGKADKPMGIFTGDFVFVGDVGRPDLLEKAAGFTGTAAAGAKDLYYSLERFKKLPDYLQVWPAHGAGSACGKALGAIPTSTVGYEKQFNWALQFSNEEAFVKELLDGQPEPPTYFKIMKHVNKVGPALLKDLALPQEISIEELQASITNGNTVIDTRSAEDFAQGHLPGSLNIPFTRSFPNWAGWLVDYNHPVSLVASSERISEIVQSLRSVGIDHIPAYVHADAISASANITLQSSRSVSPKEMLKQLEAKNVHLLDVRGLNEWKEGNLPGAIHIMLGTLPNRLTEVPADQKKPIVVYCASGVRSAIGVSILQANGIENVLNLDGGIERWQAEVETLGV